MLQLLIARSRGLGNNFISSRGHPQSGFITLGGMNVGGRDSVLFDSTS